MTIRITPVKYLDTCVLDLDSIKGIVELVKKNFALVSCSCADSSADDNFRIKDEKPGPFLDAISRRKTLDYFQIIGKDESSDKELDINFGMSENKVSFGTNPSQENSLEHFVLDLRKFLLLPSFSQKFSNLLRISPIHCWIILYRPLSNAFWKMLRRIFSQIFFGILWFFLLGY